MDAVNIVRLAFLGATAAVLAAFYTPAVNTRFFAYGARKSSLPPSSMPRTRFPASLLNVAAAVQVPHSWFTAFYVVSVTMSLIWATDYSAHGPLVPLLAARVRDDRTTMNVGQVYFAWALMLVQGSRRLYESITLNSPSKSTMWIGHYFIGLAYYVGVSVAVWIEGASALQDSHSLALGEVYSLPTARTIFATLLFIAASAAQHICHAHLYFLKRSASVQPSKPGSSTYKLPTHPFFQYSHTPHYFAECLIYVSLAILAAPVGHWVNKTLSCTLVFVAVNLGLTASGTAAWYEKTFGSKATEGRARLVPFIF